MAVSPRIGAIHQAANQGNPMDWHELPFFARAGILGLGIGLFLGWLTQSAMVFTFAASLVFLLGLLADGIRIWFVWTRECAWCGKRISPFTRNKLLNRELEGSEHWYCSPRCLTEWHRRHFQDRKQFNLLSEGNPLVIISKAGGD